MHNNPISPAGVMIFLVWQNRFLLILRDDKPEIANPNSWSPPTGGVEQGEDFFEAIKRELEEEIHLVPKIITTLGVSAKGNCFFFGELTDEEKELIVLGEGQRYAFFSYKDLPRSRIKGAFRVYLEKYPEIFRRISEEWHTPKGSELGLALWEKSQPDK